MNRPLRQYLVLGLAVLILVGTAGGRARADAIDVALMGHADKIRDVLRSHDYQHVGVLTFRVKKGEGPTSFRGGMIVHTLPARLENALLLSVNEKTAPLGIVRNASAVAGEKLRGASYRSPEDRARLFRPTYPLAWGSPPAEVQVDAFLAGKIVVSPDSRTARIEVEVFDRENPAEVREVTRFDVRVDRHILADLGQGFSLSKGQQSFLRAVTEDDIVSSVSTSAEPKTNKDEPKTNKDPSKTVSTDEEYFPVTLKLFYDGQQQPLEPDPQASGDSNFLAPNPAEGQELQIGLENVTKETLAAVVTVNGISTLYEQSGQPSDLNKWVLEPRKEYRIKGYHQKDDKSYISIRALSEADSVKNFEDLGGASAAGLIHLYVFRPLQEVASAPPIAPAIRRLSEKELDEKKPSSLSELQLLINPGKFNRGLFAWGDTREETLQEKQLGKVQLTDTIVVRYYRLQREP